MHGVLTAHLIGECRHAESVLNPPHNIQIGLAGFHHHHIGTFLQIQRDFLQGLITVGRVHLIRSFVAFAECRGRTHGIPERPVVGGGVLRRVGHDLGVDVGASFQCLADCADAAVHHVTRRDDVSTRIGTDERLATQRIDRYVVDHVASVIDDAVLTVTGVGIQCCIRHDPELRDSFLHGSDSPWNQAFGIPGLLTAGRTQVGSQIRKECDHGNPQLFCAAGLSHQKIDGQPLNAWH